MPDELPAPTIRMLQGFLEADESLGDTLTHICARTAEAFDAEMAGLTLEQDDGSLVTSVYTDARVPVVDEAQYQAGRGPCVDAFRTGAVQRIRSTEDDGRWPEYDAVARENGIHSTLALPLVVQGRSLGSLNLYGRRPGHFDSRTEELGSALAGHVAIAVASSSAYWGAKTLAENLAVAMQSRATIEQAKGVIMATSGCSADEAFTLLRLQSQSQNQKLREIAAEIVERQRRTRHS